MIEDHTNWLQKIRYTLAGSSVLSGAALVQLPLVYHEADKFTVLMDHAKQCP